ncbi:protein THYLAKOID ASSEMBLY 8-like, chloroplastic [Cornus florida]|uniref:protein THYLAKOID ASSEMBLY 8-like, chloroplastic n=1 Tax=Cornus florida TaxID=4283 RepID=UPI0028A266F2|nr:protein THYLAKOID ASSEMBLY 8-like, chloroplastic [Cornus florida]
MKLLSASSSALAHPLLPTLSQTLNRINLNPPFPEIGRLQFGCNNNNDKKMKNGTTGMMGISSTSRDRSKNRKPLQRGRNLSIEAIQTVQALKRNLNNNNKKSNCGDDYNSSDSLEQVFRSKLRRLLKFDMMAVLRELLRQNQCYLALKVFEDVRKEDWYKPQVSLYADMISVLASNGLFEKVELLFMQLKMESSLEPDTEGFNALLESLMINNFTGMAMECFQLMKTTGCEPDKSSFKIMINGLESEGETGLSAIVRLEAQKCYGFLEENEEMTVS